MPPVHPAAVSAGVIALSVAVAAAIALYESPEVRRRAEELRRRIAVALQAWGDNTWGDNTSPNGRQDQYERDGPLFNRPEDAEGFMMTRHGSHGTSDDIDADEASRRRQREELLYWNRLHLERLKEQERSEAAEAIAAVERATQEAAAAAGLPMTTFDQLLREDGTAEKGSYVVKTGTDYNNGYSNEDPLNGGLVRRRRPDGVRGLNASVYTDPFSDEHGIDSEDQHQAVSLPPSSMHASTLAEGAYIGPDADDLLSDIYNATEPDTTQNAKIASVLEAAPMASVSSMPASEVFFDATAQSSETIAAATSSEPTLLERALADNEFMTASQGEQTAVADQTDAEADTYNSIQAWAHMSSHANSFYSPLPVSPVTAPSEPEMVSPGELTPTDSMSMVDAEEMLNASTHTLPAAASAVLVNDTASQGSATEGRYYDVISDSEDGEGLMTPTSWTEVGSVQSESDAGEAVRGRRA